MIQLLVVYHVFAVAICKRQQLLVQTAPTDKPSIGTVGAPRWNKKVVTWSLVKPSKNLPVFTQREILARSFSHWTQSAGLDISEVNQASQADIKISFERLKHDGDRHQFDGTGGTLAHAFYPPDGRVHFDDDEIWKADNPAGANLEMVATHELGHALGLTHSKSEKAVMSSIYPGYSINNLKSFALHEDDKKRIQSLYGKSSNADIQLIDWALSGQNLRASNLFQHPSPNMCRMRFDSVTELADGRIHVFKKGWIYQLGLSGQLEEGWPKPVASLFASFPKSSDATTYSHTSSRLYVFKEGYVWRYLNNRLEEGFPCSLNGHQEDIQASFTHPNGSIYLISKRHIYQLREVSLKVMLIGRIKDVFSGAPYNPDAAVCVGGRGFAREPGVHLFRGRWYYRLDIRTLSIMPGYPKDKRKEWLQC